jgi:DNA-binding transcriptional MerR regulator
MHSEVWKYALNDWLKLFRIYCKNIFEANPEKKEHFIQYITPDGTRELLKVTPEILDNDSIGLFLSAGGQDQFYRDSMLQFAHAFSQNAGEGMEAVSDMIKAISSGSSPEEIHKMIQLNSEKQQQRQERLQQMQLEQAEKIKQREDEIREDEQAHAVEREHIKGSYMLQGKAIDVYDKQETLNADQDGIPDPLEAAKIMHDMNQDNIATQQKNRELDIKEKQANKTKAN